MNTINRRGFLGLAASAGAVLLIAGSVFADKGPGTFFDSPEGTANVTVNDTAAKGQVVKTIAFLGGSITEMNGYRPLVMKQLRAKWPDVAFVEIAAGLSSTCSDAAALRLRRDVLANGVPDVLVIEEAVNDDQDGHFNRGGMIEGLGGAIRQMRTANPRCAVVVALMVNEGQFKDLSAGKTPVAYAAHREIAAHYGAEVADVGTALVESAKKGGLGWKEYRDCHPSPEGCAFGADIVTAAICRVFDPKAAPKEYAMPEMMDKNKWSLYDPKEIPFSSLKLGAGWHLSKPDWEKIPGVKRAYFTQGEVLWTDTPGAEIEIPFEGTKLMAMMTSGPDCGKIEVSVDGGAYSLKTPLAYYGALHYPHAIRLTWGCKPGKHVARVRCATWKRIDKPGTENATLRFHGLWCN